MEEAYEMKEGGNDSNHIDSNSSDRECQTNSQSEANTDEHVNGMCNLNALPSLTNKTLDTELKNNCTGATKKTENNAELSPQLTSKFEEIDEDTICGIGSFKPKWLQKYATIKMYLTLYSILGVVQGSYYAYNIGILSTLEKRFAFDSKISGIIMTADELTPLFLGIFVGYFGGKAHRPRMLGLGMFLSSVCCFISALPYFMYGTQILTLAQQNATDPEICSIVHREEHCESEDRPPTLSAVSCLVIASLLKGFGNLAYYAVGMTYLDDNSRKKNTPVYFAVGMTLRMLGPTSGFLMSSAFLKYYENPLVDPGFGPEDPRWVGGWWMGFVLQGILILIFSFPIALFPRRIPRDNQKPTGKLSTETESYAKLFTGLFSALKRLAKNPLYVCFVMYTVMSDYGVIGHYIMLPRYMEHQFRLSASDASLYSGPPGLIAIMVATVIGGVYMWAYTPSTKLVVGLMVLQEVIYTVGCLFLMLPGCENIQMANFGLNQDGLNLIGDCNANCLCSRSDYTPICGPDGQTTYFSPCFAGCTEMTKLNDTEVFLNCSCAQELGRAFVGKPFESGFCRDDSCWSQALIYITMLPILYCVSSILRIGHFIVLMRSVEPQDKSVAVGTVETVLCLLALLPYPTIIGAVIDSTCLVWEESCNDTGNCWFYDMDKFNYYLHGLSSTFCGFATLCFFGVYCFRSRLRDLYKDDEDDVGVEKKCELQI